MQRKVLILLAVCLLLVSIMIGGCNTMEPKPVIKTIKYPDRPITIIVPFSAGGVSDLIARALEQTAIQHLGQPLVVVNKPGGAGTLAWNELAGTTPDGYTIGITGIEIILQPLYGSIKYNYPTALEPLVQVSAPPLIMIVQAEQAWQNIDDLVKYACQHPGELKLGNGGVGSASHVVGETFSQASNITTEAVPFRGASEALAALLGGHIQVAFVSSSTVQEHLKAGTVRALAVTAERRLTDPEYADVPTFKEQGLDVVFSNWVGVAAPKEMPSEVKDKRADGLKVIIADPKFQKKLENIGLEVDYLNPEESQKKWMADNQRLSKIVKETGILDRIKEQRK